MKLAQSLLFITSVSVLSGCIVVAKPSYANYHDQQELVINAQMLTALSVEAGAGSLVILGADNVSEITVIADIYTEKSNSESYQLTLTESGDSATLIAKVNRSSGFWYGDSPHIDIKVTMPSKMMLNVDDGSGASDISNINGTVEITDGSGELNISDINGDLIVKDGSGGLFVNNVTGNVSIDDGSGALELSEVGGNVDIDDGSGSIVAKYIAGSAFIEDGSGDLTLRNVDGIITLDDGSGDIDVEQAGGLTIIDSGSGGLRVKKVKGGFEIDS